MLFSRFTVLSLFFTPLAYAWYTPTPGTTWHIVLINKLKAPYPSVAAIDADLFDNKDIWADVKSKGYKTICYFSTQYEDWRPDAEKFQPADLGNSLDGWDGERWVNSKSTNVRNIMMARLDLAVQSQCDAVDPDNIDVYLHDGGGFGLTEADQVDYVKFLAAEAHKRGLGIGLKNGGAIVTHVLDAVDFEVNEQCQEYSDLSDGYDECKLYQPFIANRKAVFGIEYVTGTPSQPRIDAICKNTIAQDFSTLIKNMELDEWVVDCSKQM